MRRIWWIVGFLALTASFSAAFEVRMPNGVHLFPDGITGPIYDKGGQVFNVVAFGARCNNSSDDRAAIQKAIDAASAVSGTVLVPQASCYVADTLTITTNNVTLRGEGNGSILRFPSSIGPYIEATDVSGITISDLRIEGGGIGSGAFGAAIDLVRVTDATVRGVTAYDPDDFGIRLLDCDRVVVTDMHVIGEAARYTAGSQPPYGFLFDGTGNSTLSNSTAYKVLFGVLMQGGDTTGDTASGRAGSYVVGNHFDNVIIDTHKSHGFSLNTHNGNVVSNSTVRNYEGTTHPRLAFQNKSIITPSTDEYAVGNVFIGNVAEDVDTCFGTNDGGRTGFYGNTCRNAQYDGVWLNGSIYDIVDGLAVVKYNAGNSSRGCIRTEAASHAQVSNLKCEPDAAGTSTAFGIDVRSSSVNGTYDNIDLIGTFNTCLSISSGSNNTVIKAGVRMNAASCLVSIDDDVTNTLYPRSFSAEYNAADSGLHLVDHPLRGLVVGRVRYITTTAIGGGGTLSISVGQNGSTSKILASTALSSSAGTIVSYDANSSPALSARDITAGTMIQANLSHASTVSSGRVGVTVDGIDGPPPATVTTTTTTTTTT